MVAAGAGAAGAAGVGDGAGAGAGACAGAFGGVAGGGGAVLLQPHQHIKRTARKHKKFFHVISGLPLSKSNLILQENASWSEIKLSLMIAYY